MTKELTPEELEHMRIMAQAMRATTPEERRELDMLLYGPNPPLSVLLAAPDSLATLIDVLGDLRTMLKRELGRTLVARPFTEQQLLATCDKLEAAIAKAEPDAS